MSYQAPKDTGRSSPSAESFSIPISIQLQPPRPNGSNETAGGGIQYVPPWWNPRKLLTRPKTFRRTIFSSSQVGSGNVGTDDSGPVVTDNSQVIPNPKSAVAPSLPPKCSISFCPASHPAEPFLENAQSRLESSQSRALSILHSVAPNKRKIVKEVLHSSFPANLDLMADIIPKRNGFVDTVIEAYNNHRKLIIRPDDVWLSIMTQFSFFVDGNSKALCKVFVAHGGKRQLVVKEVGDRFSMDTPLMIRRMMALMEENITDPSLREWIMPDFTTTNEVDRTICAIVMMGTMKNYFSYKIGLACGIPEVTLEGEKRDWETILTRIEQLKKYGVQTIAWYHLLRPIISRFVNAYDKPKHSDNLKFWSKVADYRGGGSGPRYLTGWITAFCVFNERGKWQGGKLNEEPLRPADPFELTPSQFAAAYMVPDRHEKPYLTLDGFPYPLIDSKDVPCGYVSVDLLLKDGGEEVKTMFIAGLIGLQICRGEKTWLFQNGVRDTIRPSTGWWLVVKAKEGEEIPDNASGDN